VELRLTEKKDVEGVGMKSFSLVMTSMPAKDKGEEIAEAVKGLKGSPRNISSKKE